jgi:hypothetical protein
VRLVRLALTCTLIAACAHHAEARTDDAGTMASARSPTDEVVLSAIVSSIENAPTGDRRRRWLVTMKVQKVLSGRFTEPVLVFPVHSPVMLGLEVGKTYTIRATRKGNGYEVHEFQTLRTSPPQPEATPPRR